MDRQPDARRSTPPMDPVLADPGLQAATARLGADLVKKAAAAALARCRGGEITADEVVCVALRSLPSAATTLHAVINATGVVVHTNLGRAPLSVAAVAAISIAAGATDVELSLDSGRRDRRGRGTLAAVAEAVPSAGGVHIVNNGAAALALVTRVLAAGRTVVVARGEMVEIGDGFRIPELLESLGATLREVGTTNRVRLEDYSAAIDDSTAFILKVHPSNFVVAGFTSSLTVAELATLPVPGVFDIGSGLLSRHPRLPEEPNAADALKSGATLVTASGDKLLGGPQCGLLLGDAALVESLRRHPFARALRVDKLTLAALEATLTGPPPPVTAALAVTQSALRSRAAQIVSELDGVVVASVVDSEAAVGGGGAPDVVLPSAAVTLPTAFAPALRTGPLPVLGHIERGLLLLDLIAVDPKDDVVVVEAVRYAARALHG